MIATTHCERAWDVTSYRVSRRMYRFSTKRVNTGSFWNEYWFLSVPEYRYATLITSVFRSDSGKVSVFQDCMSWLSSCCETMSRAAWNAARRELSWIFSLVPDARRCLKKRNNNWSNNNNNNNNDNNNDNNNKNNNSNNNNNNDNKYNNNNNNNSNKVLIIIIIIIMIINIKIIIIITIIIHISSISRSFHPLCLRSYDTLIPVTPIGYWTN